MVSDQDHPWENKLEEAQALFKEKPVDYARILDRLRGASAEELPGDLLNRIENFRAKVEHERLGELQTLSEGAEKTYQDRARSPQDKLEGLELILAPRLYPDGTGCDPIWSGRIAVLKDERHPDYIKMWLDYIDSYLRYVLDTLSYDDANTWVSDQRAKLELGLLEARGQEALVDLVGPMDATLERLRKKRDHLAQYVFNRGGTRSLKKLWVELIKENLRKAERLAGEYRDGEYVNLSEETDEMRREYATDCFDTAAEKLAIATGLSLQEWQAGTRALNSKRELPIIQKDIKVGLITLEPSKYMDLYNDVEVLGDRSLDPRPFDLDVVRRDAFNPLLEALLEALALADEVRTAKENIDKGRFDSDLEKLSASYFICTLYPSEDIQNQLDGQEDLARREIERDLDRIKSDEQWRIWALDDSTDDLDEFRTFLEQHPMYTNRIASEEGRTMVRKMLKELNDLKFYRRDAVKQRKEFSEKLDRLVSLLDDPASSVSEIERLHVELERIHNRFEGRVEKGLNDLQLPGINGIKDLVLGGRPSLEEQFSALSERLARRQGMDKAFRDLNTLYARKAWERVVSTGRAYYDQPNESSGDREMWLEGRQMYLHALAHAKLNEAGKLSFDHNLSTAKSLIEEADYAIEQRMYALQEQGAERDDSPDVEEELNALVAKIVAYEKENSTLLEIQDRVRKLTDPSLPFASRDYIEAYQQFGASNGNGEDRFEAPRQEFAKMWRGAVSTEIEVQVNAGEKADPEAVKAIRRSLAELKKVGWWEDQPLERRFNDLLITQFSLWQRRGSVDRVSVFGLALTQDQYGEWQEVLHTRHGDRASRSHARDEMGEVAAYYRISQSEQKEGADAQIKDLSLALSDRSGKSTAADLGRHLLVDALLYRIDRYIQDNNSADEAQLRDLLKRLEETQRYRRQLTELGQDALASLWEYRMAGWRAFLERRISHALKQLKDLENLIEEINIERAPHWLDYRCRETRDLFLDYTSVKGLPRLILAFINEDLGRFIQSGQSTQYGSIEQLVSALEYALILTNSEDSLHQFRAQRAIAILNPQMAQIATHLETQIGHIVGQILPNDLVQAAERCEALTLQLRAIAEGLADPAIRAEIEDEAIPDRYDELYEQAQVVNGYIAAGLKQFRETINQLRNLVTNTSAGNIGGHSWDFSLVSNAQNLAASNCSQAQMAANVRVNPIYNLNEVENLVNSLMHYLIRMNTDDDGPRGPETRNIMQYSLTELIEYIPQQLNPRQGDRCPFERYSRAHKAMAVVEERLNLVQNQLDDYRHLFGGEGPRFVLPDDFLVTWLQVAVRDQNGVLVQKRRGLEEHREIIGWLHTRAKRWQQWLEDLSLRYEEMVKRQEPAEDWYNYLSEIAQKVAGDKPLPGAENFFDPEYYDALAAPNFIVRALVPREVPYSQISNQIRRYHQTLNDLKQVIQAPPGSEIPSDLVECFKKKELLPEDIVRVVTQSSDVAIITELDTYINDLSAHCDELDSEIKRIVEHTDIWITLLQEAMEFVKEATRQEEKRKRRADEDKLEAYSTQLREYERLLNLLQGKLSASN